ncbi:ergosterol biosynthetic protein 28 homolog isoform X2 [Bombina bombina]|uniref:ergosterol biosynthetic protein 28 homolog isoform X2 n=1 Tax=Bombina bombina TaxID=8345 RepID=UPI00235A4B53|nr:ergosterol biosynthetic protein 28 homolog isoform X2 [Bombina bombina]
MSRFLAVLRSWLMMVSIIAAGNTLQSFRDHSFLSDKLYTGRPSQVNGLQARTFGIWTLLSSVIRCVCAIDIHNKTFLHPGNAHRISVSRGSARAACPSEQEKELNPSVVGIVSGYHSFCSWSGVVLSTRSLTLISSIIWQ